MDEIVKAAMAKWPSVPYCYGWLALDARGDWYLRDAQAQAAGDFPAVKGSRIEHTKLREFIARNYAADEAGAWYFQNGPQRVYVLLEAAPWVWRLQPPAAAGQAPRLVTHTGAPGRYAAACVDEAGRLYVDSDIGLGLVHSLDVELASAAVESGLWRVEEVASAGLPARFNYQRAPAARD